jgi:hypothetical protein
MLMLFLNNKSNQRRQQYDVWIIKILQNLFKIEKSKEKPQNKHIGGHQGA